MLGLRCRLAFGLADDIFSVVLGATFMERLVAALPTALVLAAGAATIGGAMGDAGVGEHAFLRALLTFLHRNFSSSSEEVTSEAFASKSMLIAADSRLLRELLLNEGARFNPRGNNEDPVKVSERLMRRTAIKIG
jgi:hypothetical protein